MFYFYTQESNNYMLFYEFRFGSVGNNQVTEVVIQICRDADVGFYDKFPPGVARSKFSLPR